MNNINQQNSSRHFGKKKGEANEGMLADLAKKVGRPTARQIKTKNNKYMASDCPLAGKHLKQIELDTNIANDEALHPIELLAKSYKL